MSEQCTNAIMMIRPARFGFNPQTAESNAFQSQDEQLDAATIAAEAVREFDEFVLQLKHIGVEVIVIHDTPDENRPDAIFPNNWISFHENGTVITYPMHSKNRRLERKEEIIETLGLVFDIKHRYSFEFYENDGKFLEGTGSMVLDRPNSTVYACLGPRTDIFLLDQFCLLMNYKLVNFYAYDQNNTAIYHTNVIMAIGDKYAVVCLDCITDEEKKKEVAGTLEASGKEVIAISLDQVYHFAGNMLQVTGRNDEKFLILSRQAYDSLTTKQTDTLTQYNKLIPIDVSTIEKYGGGSVRCMMAEVFLPKKEIG